MMTGTSQDKLVDELSRELETQDNLLVVKFSNPYIVGQPVRKPDSGAAQPCARCNPTT
jgi:hypothetical protein